MSEQFLRKLPFYMKKAKFGPFCPKRDLLRDQIKKRFVLHNVDIYRYVHTKFHPNPPSGYWATVAHGARRTAHGARHTQSDPISPLERCSKGLKSRLLGRRTTAYVSPWRQKFHMSSPSLKSYVHCLSTKNFKKFCYRVVNFKKILFLGGSRIIQWPYFHSPLCHALYQPTYQISKESFYFFYFWGLNFLGPNVILYCDIH